MLIDFHTHSTASDGALSPAALVERAREAGVSMLAITDHDTLDGYLAARELLAEDDPVQLVAGIELSCVWAGVTIHVLGLGVDHEHPAMREAIAFLEDARARRARKIDERLARLGFPGALAGAAAIAGESQVGRPHFAAWMVAQQFVADHNEAFDRYLGQGKPGDVKTYWPPLRDVVAWIVAAGGVAVLAHPLKYRFTGMKLRRLVTDFVAAGGGGLEVSSGRQSADQRAHLDRLAQAFSLEVSMGSDFHRDSTYGAPVGVPVSSAPQGLAGVWQRWASGE